MATAGWRNPDAADWARGDNRVLIAILYASAADGHPPDRVAIAINAGNDAVPVQWPEPRAGHAWRMVADTTLAGGLPAAPALADESASLGARSVMVLVEEASAVRAPRSAGIEPEVLARLAAAAGIAPDWLDISGRRHVVPAETTRALLAAMGLRSRHDRGGP